MRKFFLILKIYIKKGWLPSATFLINNNVNYIITFNCLGYNENTGPIKIFDFKGNLIKIINDSIENFYFIDLLW